MSSRVGEEDPLPEPVRAEPSAWNLPNTLTVLRLFMVPGFASLLWLSHGEHAGWLAAATGVFALATATDYYDGSLARAQGTVTSFGKIADPIADKALTGTAFVGLSLLGLLPWWVTAIILGRELGVTGLRFVVLRYGVIPASRGGKSKTVLQMLAIGWYLWPWEAVAHQVSSVVGVGGFLRDFDVVGPWLMGAAFVVTVVTGADYVRRAWRLRREAVS